MKHFADLNYYDLLEVPPTASRVQIQRAYELAKKTFGEESMATYSLFDAESRRRIMEKVEEAFTVLMNEERRRQYDLSLGLKVTSPATGGSGGPQACPSSEADEAPRPTAPSQPVQSIDLSQQEINGSFLKYFRERQGIPLQEVAASTRINITYLQYIEQDYYKGLPAEVYLRGYLIQYAKVLGLDPVQVADRYLSLYRNWKKVMKRE